MKYRFGNINIYHLHAPDVSCLAFLFKKKRVEQHNVDNKKAKENGGLTTNYRRLIIQYSWTSEPLKLIHILQQSFQNDI